MVRVSMAVLFMLGCAGDAEKVGLCNDCTVPSDCASDACACVWNETTYARYCWACVPPDYDPLKGARQKETYNCRTVRK